MPQVAFVDRAYSRPAAGLPSSRLANLYPETTEGIAQSVRISRPCLANQVAVGTGPNRGLFSKPGVFGGAVFVASGAGLYTIDGTLLGALPGTDKARFAASSTQLVVVAGGYAFIWDGTTFGQITDTDLPMVIDVEWFGDRFVFAQAQSGRIWYSNINDASNIDGLAFTNAESSPDFNVGLRIIGDQLAIYGGDSTEFWSVTSDADNPYQKNDGTRYQKGCASRDSITLLDNAHFFVGADGSVYRTEDVANRVSDHGVEDKLRRCTNLAGCTAFGVVIEGHAWYVLNIPGVGSMAYDVAGKGWAEWTSFGRTPAVFRGCTAQQVGTTVYVGDDTTGNVWTLSVGVFQDGSDPVTFLATAFAKIPTGDPVRCVNVILLCARGVGLTTGQGSNPIVEMRYSDNLGRTWSRWRQGSLGKIGEYEKKTYWTGLGTMRPPGRLFEFRVTDPVVTTLGGVYVNEPSVR